jgi:exodeoxyribonuclease V alpha subunit
VIVILPEDDNPLLTRELLYTAVTRAKKRVTVIANNQQLISAIKSRSQRQSGILGVLWPGAERSDERVAENPAKPVAEPAFSGTPVQTELDF